MKETAIGGFFMPRRYSHISEYEKEIIEIDNMQCYLVSDTDYRTLIFESGGYIFTISSCEDKTELIKMAESVIGQTEDIQ